LKFASLGSGSRGNATLVSVDDTLVLLDCGFTLKEAQRRCARLGVQLQDVDAVLLTHEHSDHAQGIGPIARKYSIPVYMTPGSYFSRDFGKIPNLQLIKGFSEFRVGNILISPVTVPHDAKEPAQFIFQSERARLGILTDLGSITPHILQAYSRCDAYLVEFNHDLQMLFDGAYPYALKQRVASDWGHLNNQQAATLVESVITETTQHLIVGHISQQNNTLEKAAECVSRAINGYSKLNVQYACQENGFPWVDIR